FFAVIVPFLFSFHPRIRFDKKFGSFFLADFIAAICFISWDIYFTNKHVWGFSDQYTLGIKFINLPVEEILFFIYIPFSCVFTFYCLKNSFKERPKPVIENLIVSALAIFLFIIGLRFLDRAYTSCTFISLGILLLLIRFIFRAEWLYKLFIVY